MLILIVSPEQYEQFEDGKLFYNSHDEDLPPLVSYEELQAHFNTDAVYNYTDQDFFREGYTRDQLIDDCLEDGTFLTYSAIEQYCGRRFVAAPSTTPKGEEVVVIVGLMD